MVARHTDQQVSSLQISSVTLHPITPFEQSYFLDNDINGVVYTSNNSNNGKERFIMSKAAIVFWSATGNTEAMADAVKAGAQEAGAEVSVFAAADFDADMVADFDALAFGCPAMGDEVLEEGEFRPMFDAVLPALNGKKVALFGSYGWGDGQWMRDWEEACQTAGVTLACECVIANDAPDDEAVAACKALGAALV